MFARLSAFLIWALVAATVVFWALRLAVHPIEVPSNALAVGTSGGIRGDLTRLLGSAPVVAAAATAVPEASSRFKLIGVMAPKLRSASARADYGLALIAVDGKPARAFAVGASVESGLVLQSVGLRSAAIVSRQGAPTVMLELPPVAEPATGRPAGGLGGGSSANPSTNPATLGVNRPGSVPPNIATLPQVPTMQNPAMAGQPPPGVMPMSRQPPQAQDTAVPQPAREAPAPN